MLIILARDPANFLAFPNVTREQEVYALQGEEKPPLSHLQSRWLPRSKNEIFFNLLYNRASFSVYIALKYLPKACWCNQIYENEE